MRRRRVYEADGGGAARHGRRSNRRGRPHNGTAHKLHGAVGTGGIPHVQTSWVKLGVEGTRLMLQSGADDLGGTLIEETISRMAGSQHGSTETVEELVEIDAGIGRPVRERTTTYGTHSADGRRTMTIEPHENVAFVVLAKALVGAKTRLGLEPESTGRAALRLVEQTVHATLGSACSGAVYVVTSGPLISRQSTKMGVVVVPEGRPRGMNQSGALGPEQALRERPLSPVAVMVADLHRPGGTQGQPRPDPGGEGEAAYIPDHH